MCPFARAPRRNISIVLRCDAIFFERVYLIFQIIVYIFINGWNVVFVFQHFFLYRNLSKGCPFALVMSVSLYLAMLSSVDKIFIVCQWGLYRYYTAIRLSFRKRSNHYHGKNLPSVESIRSVVQHFESRDSRRLSLYPPGNQTSTGKSCKD